MNQKVSVSIDGLAVGGAFIGKEKGSNRKIFVREVCPDEEVVVEVLKESGNFIEGRLVEIKKASAHRVTPSCPLFGECGGCDLQHLEISAQREAKVSMVESMLRVQGGVAPSDGVLLLGKDLPAFSYRRRGAFHLNKSGVLGFNRVRTGDVVDLHACPLMEGPINTALHSIRPFLGRLAPWVDGVVIEIGIKTPYILLKIREEADPSSFAGNQSLLSEIVGAIHSEIYLQHNLKKYVVERDGIPTSCEASMGHFSQVNEAANKILKEIVASSVEGSLITELYAGSGNLTFELAAKGRSIRAVEVDPVLVREGERIAKELAYSKSVSFFCMSAEAFLKDFEPSSSLLLDPPRSGAKEVVRRLKGKKVEEIVYVSCNLPSLVRDVQELNTQGFRLERVSVIDMFPQTHHVETVSVFSR